MASTIHEKRIEIICVPTEAGTHFSGQSLAPEALIKTGGLATKLQSAGHQVSVDGNVLSSKHLKQIAAWAPSPKINGVRNEDKTIQVMNAVQHHLVGRPELRDSFPIIIGGDCSITPAVFSAQNSWHEGKKVGLLYIDGDVDLTLPSQTDTDGSSAIMDSMTITHITGRAGGLDSMRQFAHADGKPLVNKDNIVLFGFDPLQPSTEHWVYLLENGFKAYSRPTVRADPVARGREALEWLAERVDAIYVHFDVDVIDSGEFPLANYPHYAGLEAKEALDVLQDVLADERVHGLTLTEINPNNDPHGTMVKQIADTIVQGLMRRKR